MSSFLLSFRLSFAYDRYWEGATAIHLMMSKWIDCAMCIAAFHYQSDSYKAIRPPAFGSLDGGVTEDQIEGRFREVIHNKNPVNTNDVDEESVAAAKRRKSIIQKVAQRIRPSLRQSSSDPSGTVPLKRPLKSINRRNSPDNLQPNIPIPQRFQNQLFNSSTGKSSRQGSLQCVEDTSSASANSHTSKNALSRQPKPSLFLQEAAHLISLLNAVALSTLRNDIDQAASPVTPYYPGQPWPCVDSGRPSVTAKKLPSDQSTFWDLVYFCLGLNRSTKHRTLYNAARPFGILGGVSDNEILLLQRARGPYAKVSLVTMWLQEFISRESLAGSTGVVAGPMLSRLYQFISDGVVGYNQARKVAYVPYPFVGAQITAFFSMAIIFIFPLLFTNFVTKLWLACFMNFWTVLCFLGLHEVARELENPFQNAPNDLPLTTFQAQVNETLITLYAGYHPDGWWEVIPETEPSDSEDTRESNATAK